jgi:transposase
MDVLHARCAGLDVHRDSVVACARLATAEGTAYEVATFGTMAADLERLARWLSARGVTQVAMEATGVYWKPVWAALAAQGRADPGQCRPRQECPGAQDRRE